MIHGSYGLLILPIKSIRGSTTLGRLLSSLSTVSHIIVDPPRQSHSTLCTKLMTTTRQKSGAKSNIQRRATQALTKKLNSAAGTIPTVDPKNKAEYDIKVKAETKSVELGYALQSKDALYTPISSSPSLSLSSSLSRHSVLSDLQNTNKEDELVSNSVSSPTYSSHVQREVSISRRITPSREGHLHEFAPRIVVVGVGGAGGNAVNNMIARNLHGVDFLVLNTDTQHLSTTLTDNRLQIGSTLTSGLGCGANPDAGRLAAEESREEITDLLSDAHMVFITAGMGGGTGTGAAPVVAEICYNFGILTVGVVTKPFRFEGTHRMRLADEGITALREVVDSLIVIPNQNLFHLVDKRTSFIDSFAMADDVLLAGVKSITDLMTMPGLINLDFADVQSVMHGMGNAIIGTGQAGILQNDTNNNDRKKDDGDGHLDGEYERSIEAARQALANPLLGESMDIGTAKGMLVNITGGRDMTLWEVDRAAQCITEKVHDENANIIFGSAYDESLDGCIRVSVVATGINE